MKSPQERAREIVDNCEESPRICGFCDCESPIAAALREYGDERERETRDRIIRGISGYSGPVTDWADLIDRALADEKGGK